MVVISIPWTLGSKTWALSFIFPGVQAINFHSRISMDSMPFCFLWLLNQILWLPAKVISFVSFCLRQVLQEDNRLMGSNLKAIIPLCQILLCFSIMSYRYHLCLLLYFLLPISDQLLLQDCLEFKSISLLVQTFFWNSFSYQYMVSF